MKEASESLSLLYALLYFSVFSILYDKFIDKPILASVAAFLITIVFLVSNKTIYKK